MGVRSTWWRIGRIAVVGGTGIFLVLGVYPEGAKEEEVKGGVRAAGLPTLGTAGFWAADPWNEEEREAEGEGEEENEEDEERTTPPPAPWRSRECRWEVGASYFLGRDWTLTVGLKEETARRVAGEFIPFTERVGRFGGKWQRLFALSGGKRLAWASTGEFVQTQYWPQNPRSVYHQEVLSLKQELWPEDWPLRVEFFLAATGKVFPEYNRDSLAQERGLTLRWKEGKRQAPWEVQVGFTWLDKDFPELQSWSYLKGSRSYRLAWRPGAWQFNFVGEEWRTRYPWGSRPESGRLDWGCEIRGPLAPRLELFCKLTRDQRAYPHLPAYDYTLAEWELAGRFHLNRVQALTLATRGKAKDYHAAAKEAEDVAERFWQLRWENRSARWEIYCKWELGERWRPPTAPAGPRFLHLYGVEMVQGL